jgi:hypothetical protein
VVRSEHATLVTNRGVDPDSMTLWIRVPNYEFFFSFLLLEGKEIVVQITNKNFLAKYRSVSGLTSICIRSEIEQNRCMDPDPD